MRKHSASAVANDAVRNIIAEISKKTQGAIKKEDLDEAAAFFNWKCPYTGKDLKTAVPDDLAVDHIVPENQTFCGLNIMGNVVRVYKEANDEKKDKTVEEFLLKNDTVLANVPAKVRQERLDKIREFQKHYGYDPDTIQQILSPYFVAVYGEIKREQARRVQEAMNLAGLTAKPTPTKKTSTRAPKAKQQTKLAGVSLVLVPSDRDDFKKAIIKSKYAKITRTFVSGYVDQLIWRATKLSSNSKLMVNIKTSRWWKTTKNDLAKVKIEVF